METAREHFTPFHVSPLVSHASDSFLCTFESLRTYLSKVLTVVNNNLIRLEFSRASIPQLRCVVMAHRSSFAELGRIL